MKTIEEAANEFAIRYAPLLWEEQCRSYFKAGAEFAQRWYSVKEELPEKSSHGFSDLVLTKNSFGNIHIERYDFDYNRFTDVRYDALVKGDGQVSHWRPIYIK